MPKTKQRKKANIKSHISVLNPLLTFSKEKGGAEGEEGSTRLFISLTSEATQTN